ncbi:hypothetical protein HU830_04725 [Lactobacillus sp. DCY120]|uniref:Uncharacterized protein n=1 Tax=Bombilactobacillus apium TaxID=2675299 RepID=A0A850QXE0_9LACO|nr:hypothetical protein [Bombilactobacillus apium]NVY96474.1 hypothetical protein [Bombilactobacillus apium]
MKQKRQRFFKKSLLVASTLVVSPAVVSPSIGTFLTTAQADEQTPATTFFQGEVHRGTADWSYDPSTGTVTVQGGIAYDNVEIPWGSYHGLIVPENSKQIVFQDQLTIYGSISRLFENLKAIMNLGNLHVQDCHDFDRMFADCSSLQQLDLSSFQISDGAYVKQVFQGASNLQRLTLGDNFLFSSNSDLLSSPTGRWSRTDRKWSGSAQVSGYFLWSSLNFRSRITKVAKLIASVSASKSDMLLLSGAIHVLTIGIPPLSGVSHRLNFSAGSILTYILAQLIAPGGCCAAFIKVSIHLESKKLQI